MASKPGDLAGTDRAAILLMSLGEQDAANLLKQLDAREVQRLGVAMAELKEVSREQMTSVLDSFIGVVDGKANIASGSQDYVRRVLTQAVGKHKTDLLLDRVSTGQTGQGIEALKWMDAKAVAQIISGEHPQIAAIVLSHLDAEQSAAILPLLTEEMRTEVLMRIATLNEVPQTALTELDQLVEKQANVAPPAPLRRIGGARTVANILNAMERDKSGEELGKIEKADTEMHQQIKDLLFIFDNLLDVDDRGIQALLREVGSDTLAVALRGAEPEVQEKILKNMSKRAAEILKDDMEARGPVKLVEVEAAQKEIVVIAQRLAEEGSISLGGKGGAELSDTTVKVWSAPDMGKGAAGHKPPTVSGLADLQAEAHKEAFEQGLAEGREAGRAEVRAQVERLEGMFYDLAKPFEELDTEVERELLTLAMTLARQIVRRELKTDPTQIIGIVREAISALPVAVRDVRVHLHPEDAAVVRQNLAPTESERAWQLVEDPVMARGGCQITTATSRVDARLGPASGRS